MATPTEAVTHNAQEFLGSPPEVVIAVRVEWGPNAVRRSKDRSYVALIGVINQIVYPLLVLWNFITNARSMSGDMDAGYGILAVTSDGGRILLSSKPFQRKVPVEVLDTVPPHTTFTSDAELMETYLIPTVTVDRLQLVVNRIDFKVLLKAIEAGRVIAPEILAVLPRLKAAGAVRDTPR